MGVSLLGKEADDLLDTVREGEDEGEFGDRDEFMPAWRAGELSDQDVRRIGEFLASVRQ